MNVGAAAARNWLLTEPEVREAQYIAYLDDDAIVPTDWLTGLGAAVKTYPKAGVWGCQVVDHHNPAVIQSVDFHLTDARSGLAEGEGAEAGQSGESGQSGQGGDKHFSLAELQHQDLAFGQFHYLRPCASVTGCCHLFDRAVLEKTGGFDIHLSPSQYDDLEHDIRVHGAGFYPVYQGHVQVRHMKRSGKASRTAPKAQANANANMYMVQQKHPPPVIEAIRQADCKRLKQDLATKRQWVLKNVPD